MVDFKNVKVGDVLQYRVDEYIDGYGVVTEIFNDHAEVELYDFDGIYYHLDDDSADKFREIGKQKYRAMIECLERS